MNAIISQKKYTIEQFASTKRILSLPEVAVRLLRIAQQEDPDNDEIVRVIRTDPAISGRVLKTVNSAMFGFTVRIESIEEAIQKMGLTMLRTILLGFHLARQGESQDSLKPYLQNHWRSSLTQAAFAELIGERIARHQAQSFFLAAMMQDVGILAMLSEATDDYVKNVLDRTQFPEVISAERCFFGFSHVEVTAAMLKNWGIEDFFGPGTLSSHHDRIAPPQVSKNVNLAAVLQAANMGTEMLFSSRRSSMPLNAAVTQWADFLNSRLGIDLKAATEIVDEVCNRVNETSAIFSFDIGNGVCPERVIAEAKDLLQEIALEHQIRSVKSQKPAKIEEDLVYKDSLCGLFNRRYMNDMVPEIIKQTANKNQNLAAVFIDVDAFKSINDRFGHKTGDEAIKHVANWLKASIRKQDVAIRFGGDEFIAIFREIDEASFKQIIDRMNTSVLKLDFEGQTIRMSFSIGGIFVKLSRTDKIDPNWIIDQADQAMYFAKKNGGGQQSIRNFVGLEPV